MPQTQSEDAKRSILDRKNFRRRLAYNEKAKEKEARSTLNPDEVPQKKPRGRPRNQTKQSTEGSSSRSGQPNIQTELNPYTNSEEIAAFKLQAAPDCIYCGAQRYINEPPTFCCAKGQIVLSNPPAPVALQDLFCATNDTSKHFQTCVRTYNNTFAFTSMGIHNYDANLCRRNKGIYTFKVQGQIYHFINDMLPDGCPPRNLQLYFYDTDIISEEALQCHGTRMDKEVIDIILTTLAENPYAKFFHSLKDMHTVDEFSVILKTNPTLDQRVYNMPTTSQVAAIWVEEDTNGVNENRHIRVYAKGGHSKNIQYYYGCYDPLQYPLLFPYGEMGWHEGIEKISRNLSPVTNQASTNINIRSNNIGSVTDLIESEDEQFNIGLQKKNKVSCREYYAYKLQMRPSNETFLLHTGRLLQQFVVDMYVKLETQRLDYFRQKQKNKRTSTLNDVVQSIEMGLEFGEDIGKRVVLPVSFIGGPRNMRRRYMDAIALVQRFGKPDLFLTITCNPNWPEIKHSLRYVDEPQNRPDLVARIFNGRIHEIKTDLFKRKIFGEISAYTYVIEFQKRGLPHAHFLIVLKSRNKIISPSQCDKLISAEIPDPKQYPELYSRVKKHMIHGPCGTLNPNCTCMVRKNQNQQPGCKSKYPKQNTEQTSFDEDCFPIYRRRLTTNTVEVRNCTLDNRWVVPYSPYLLKKYDCHVNLEVCATVKSVKYLYKYIYKGHDRIGFNIQQHENEVIDEITNFQRGRWVSPPEAMWRIYGFTMAEMKPAVIHLPVHLPNHQYLNFYGNQKVKQIIDGDITTRTMLTQFFYMNNHNEVAQKLNLCYMEFPEYFVWHTQQRLWTQRKSKDVVGRLASVSPTEGERYYVRLLLIHRRSPKSYDDLLTVEGYMCSTFREAAEKHGLLLDETNIEECMTEATTYQMPSSLRRLFATLLLHCDVPNPKKSWEEHKADMCEDITKDQTISTAEAEKACLIIIAEHLNSMGKNIDDYALVSYKLNNSQEDRMAREIAAEYNIPLNEADIEAIDQLNEGQRNAFDEIMQAVTSNVGKVFFVDGPGGTGKSFLYKCLLASVRMRKWVALATASSGIAASILPGGRTAHSRFKIPIDGQDTPTCNIGKQSVAANLLKECRLIIWDEITMAHKRSIESVNALLKDIMGNTNLFGGKVIVFGGDLRQTLPVVKRGTKEDIMAASLVRSYEIWQNITRITLTQNMRANDDPSFCDFLLRVGNNKIPNSIGNKIPIPSSFILSPQKNQSPLTTLLKEVFPDLRRFIDNPYEQLQNAILTPKNQTVDEINSTLIEAFPGNPICSYSIDTPTNNNQFHCQDYLHSITPNGLPPHMLILKRGCPIMLLRNLNPSEGLCNGTRLICKDIDHHIISCTIAIGEQKGQHVFIPRIPLEISRDDDCPIPFKRFQFPVKLCFAMTINKSQGQTLNTVGIYLKEPVFSHGQLYVALSRAQKATNVRMVMYDEENQDKIATSTANIVYNEILQYIDPGTEETL